MPIASNPLNIRFNGTGRLYVAETTDPEDVIGIEVGEMDGLSDNLSSSSEEITSNRQAGNVVIATVNSETKGSVKFGMRENSVDNLEMAYSADPADTTTQLAGIIDAVEFTMAEKKYLAVGKSDCFVHKIGLGAVTGGPFDIGETVTQGGTTGKVAWVGSGFIEVIGLTGSLTSGVAIVGGTSGASAPVSSIEKTVDMVLTDHATAPTVRYAAGSDYRVDADYGFVMKMPGSTIGASAFISCSHAAMSKKTIHPMSNVGAERRLTFVTDANDRGPRMKYIYRRVALVLDGESQKIGKGEAILPMTGTLMADTTKPVGRQYLEIQVFGE